MTDKNALIDFASLSEARAALLQAQNDAELIQAQLGRGYKEDMTSKEYHDWASRTKYALAYKRNAIRQIKEWIRNHQIEPAFSDKDPIVLTWALYHIVRSNLSWTQLTPEQQRIMNATQLLLRSELGGHAA